MPDLRPQALAILSRTFGYDAFRGRNKRMFFECLTQETLDRLEPSYD